VNVRFSAFAALALGLSAYGQNATSTASDNSLEAARRDLSALPATERSRELLDKSSGLGSASLPTLAMPGGGSKPQSQPAPNAPPSATWLQDALTQTDLDRGQRRTSSDSSSPREQANNGYKSAAAPDPFGKYLEQWLSPRDLEMLRPDSRKNTDQKPINSSLELDKATLKSGVFGGAASQSPKEAVPIMPVMQNPYLVETPPTSPSSAGSLSNPFAPPTPSILPQNDRTRGPATSQPTTTNSPRPLGPVKPALSPAEAVPKAPTAPIVDDRKYFPQLRRF
jgi:hypothetical protein